MKILFVLEHYYPYIGGAEKLFQLLAEALAGEGHKVKVLTTRFRNDLPAQDQHKGVDIIRINCRNRFLFSFLSLPHVLRHAKQADLIHTTTYNAAPPAWLAAKVCRKKVIITFHEVWGKLWFNLPFASRFLRTGFYLFEKLVLSLSFDHYIAVSDFTKQKLIGEKIPVQKISKIYNGLYYEDLAKHKYEPPKKFTYTYFGRLGISKGLDLLLPAAKMFSELYPESSLVLIIPKNPKKMFKQIEQLIADLELTDHVIIRQELSTTDLRTQITNSSCVVIPSYSEGFCFVAVETVAMQVPIISSGQGALKETVSGSYLEMEEMTAKSLFENLQKAKLEKWEYREVKKFEMKDALKAYLQLYQSYIATNKSIKQR